MPRIGAVLPVRGQKPPQPRRRRTRQPSEPGITNHTGTVCRWQPRSGQYVSTTPTGPAHQRHLRLLKFRQSTDSGDG